MLKIEKEHYKEAGLKIGLGNRPNKIISILEVDRPIYGLFSISGVC